MIRSNHSMLVQPVRPVCHTYHFCLFYFILFFYVFSWGLFLYIFFIFYIFFSFTPILISYSPSPTFPSNQYIMVIPKVAVCVRLCQLRTRPPHVSPTTNLLLRPSTMTRAGLSNCRVIGQPEHVHAKLGHPALGTPNVRTYGRHGRDGGRVAGGGCGRTGGRADGRTGGRGRVGAVSSQNG